VGDVAGVGVVEAARVILILRPGRVLEEGAEFFRYELVSDPRVRDHGKLFPQPFRLEMSHPAPRTKIIVRDRYRARHIP
jgi:hypothetical protein